MIYIFLFQIVVFIIQLLVLRKVRAVDRLVDEYLAPFNTSTAVWTWDDADYEITYMNGTHE